jgi:hypothetical protein
MSLRYSLFSSLRFLLDTESGEYLKKCYCHFKRARGETEEKYKTKKEKFSSVRDNFHCTFVKGERKKRNFALLREKKYNFSHLVLNKRERETENFSARSRNSDIFKTLAMHHVSHAVRYTLVCAMRETISTFTSAAAL